MGEAWVARQQEPIKRQVALKLIKSAMDSKAVLARFEQERQALALMDHPNIARVLDGGNRPTARSSSCPSCRMDCRFHDELAGKNNSLPKVPGDHESQCFAKNPERGG